MNNCKTIAITNQKGGVGKTTTTVNLGVGLSRQGKRVLLIDADPQGSMTVSLGVKYPDDLDITLSTIIKDIIEDNVFDVDKGIISHEEGIDFIPSNIELSSTELGMFNIISREYILKEYIDKVKQNYDYILIDCMPSLGVLTINSLVSADSVIIPSQPNYLSTKGLDLLFKTISRVKRQINPNLNIEGIILTMVDNRTNNAKVIIENLSSVMGRNIKIFDNKIPHSVKVAESNLEGKSVLLHDKNSKVSIAYENLTREMINLERSEKGRFGSERVR